MRRAILSPAALRAAERPVATLSNGGEHTLALAYGNTYHVGMSSLGFQRVFELVHQVPGWSCERFFTGATSEETGVPRSLETDTPLAAFGCIAFSVSFEEDYVGLLRLLDRGRIPLRRSARGEEHPLVLMGGACAAINPLTMAEFVDVFALGAAENLLPHLLPALAEESSKAAVLARLAATAGFFVPAHHDPTTLVGPTSKLRKLELSGEQMATPGHLPTTAIVTPHTEFASKFLIEMSRGCPEKCKYCWATFGMGQFRWHPGEFILAALERARPVTDQLGFVATAVGDHPEIERILLEANRMGFRTSVSSIRIPAVTEGVLEALYASGDRSITLAPETGTDELRWKLNKPVPNSLLLEKVRLIFRAGFTGLKLYFLVGVPGETMRDIEGILELATACRAIMLEELSPRGLVGHLHLGTNILIPKPFTPWQREPMADPAELREKIRHLERGVARLPNVSLGTMSIRQAQWQSFISKAGPEAAEPLELVARGAPLSSVLRSHSRLIHPEVFAAQGADLRWHFLRTG